MLITKLSNSTEVCTVKREINLLYQMPASPEMTSAASVSRAVHVTQACADREGVREGNASYERGAKSGLTCPTGYHSFSSNVPPGLHSHPTLQARHWGSSRESDLSKDLSEPEKDLDLNPPCPYVCTCGERAFPPVWTELSEAHR